MCIMYRKRARRVVLVKLPNLSLISLSYLYETNNTLASSQIPFVAFFPGGEVGLLLGLDWIGLGLRGVVWCVWCVLGWVGV